MTTIVSDWRVDNPILKSRAIFHANETHEIPLDHQHQDIHKVRYELDYGISIAFSKVQLIAEILGRIEPTIAKQQVTVTRNQLINNCLSQSVSVGLYRPPKGNSCENGLPASDRLNVDDAGTFPPPSLPSPLLQTINSYPVMVVVQFSFFVMNIMLSLNLSFHSRREWDSIIMVYRIPSLSLLPYPLQVSPSKRVDSFWLKPLSKQLLLNWMEIRWIISIR